MAITLTLTATDLTPAENALPVNIDLTATATDSGDPSAVFAYSWHIIDKPPTSTAALDDRRNQNPQLQGVDIWGSYRLFCIAQNTSTGETSEQDPLAATADSFIDIEVLSENRSLVKPARATRNWHSRYWELVDVVEHLEAGFTDATFLASGALEVATAYEIAQVAGPSDSTNSTSFLAVTTEQLNTALFSNDAGGALPSGSTNILRDNVKNAALEKMNEVSITEMADVDTTTITPKAGQALIWSPTHTDDSGDGDTGAWVPGDVTGSSSLFGAGLCSGETLDDGDFLIFEDNCLGSEIAQLPGWHARNRNTGEGFALNFPFASTGRATSAWHAVAEAAGQGTWNDDKEAVGMVGIASKYHTAAASAYDDTLTTSEIIGLIGLGKLPSFTLSPLNLATTILGQSTTSGIGTIYGLIIDSDSAGDDHVFYDSAYHTAEELSEIQAAVSAGTYASAKLNVLHGALSSFMLARFKRWGITKLGDVDTTTNPPSDGDVLVWDSSHTDDQGGTGAWVPSPLSIGGGSGTIEGVTAGTGLTGGGTSGVVTLDVSGLTTSELAAGSLLTSSETFVDSDTQLMTAKAILDLIQDNIPASSITHTFDAHLGGSFTDEVTYNGSAYSIGVGRSPLMFMFKNPYDASLGLKDFSFTCSHMHSSTLTFSFVIFTRADLLANNYTTCSVQYTMTKTNIDVNTNNEGIGNVENTLGVSLPAGAYIGLLLNGYEKTGQDNQRWHLTLECN